MFLYNCLEVLSLPRCREVPLHHTRRRSGCIRLVITVVRTRIAQHGRLRCTSSLLRRLDTYFGMGVSYLHTTDIGESIPFLHRYRRGGFPLSCASDGFASLATDNCGANILSLQTSEDGIPLPQTGEFVSLYTV